MPLSSLLAAVSAYTVAFHLRQIFRKLSIGSLVELAWLTAEHDRGIRPDLALPEPTALANHPVGGCGPIGAAARLVLRAWRRYSLW